MCFFFCYNVKLLMTLFRLFAATCLPVVDSNANKNLSNTTKLFDFVSSSPVSQSLRSILYYFFRFAFYLLLSRLYVHILQLMNYVNLSKFRSRSFKWTTHIVKLQFTTNMVGDFLRWWIWERVFILNFFRAQNVAGFAGNPSLKNCS